MRARRKPGDIDAPDAILSTDVGKRLDAAIRRHGGKPKAEIPASRMILPPVGKFDCKDQLALDDAVEEDAP